MGKDTPGWAAALGALIVTGIFVVLALVAAGGWTWFSAFLESSAPAWVQAIGSVGAIAAAVWVAHRQHEKDVENRRIETADREVQALIVVSTLLFNATAAVRGMLIALQHPNGAFTEPLSDLRYVYIALREIPTLELPDAIAWRGVRSAIAAAGLCTDVGDEYVSRRANKYAWNDVSVRPRDVLDHQIARFEDAEKAVNDGLLRRSTTPPTQTARYGGLLVHTNDPEHLVELQKVLQRGFRW